MQYTNNSSIITAVFNSPVQYHRELAESFYPGSGHYDSGFLIGPFEYTVSLDLVHGTRDVYEVKFMLTDIYVNSDDELINLMSKIHGKQVTLSQAKYFQKHLDPFAILSTGTIYPVMSHVIYTLREFIANHKPACLVFSSFEKSRTKLYRLMVRKFFKNQQVSATTSLTGSKIFEICFRKPENDDPVPGHQDMRLTAGYSQVSLRRAAHENCGTGAGGFQPGNDCARGESLPSSLKQDNLKSPRKIKRAPLPEGARITREDIHVASRVPKIPHPESDEDVTRFVHQVRSTPLYQLIDHKVQAIAADSPDGNPILWSVGKHATGDVTTILKTHEHESYKHINWTDDRRGVHQKILGKILNPRAKTRSGERPKVVLLMGPPGSGKTMAGQPEAAKLGVDFTTINADDIKAMLPEYEGWNAAAVHEESALLAEGPLTERAIQEKHHILMDMTGGNTRKMEKIADAMHQAGYEVHVISIALPAYKSTGRAWDRFTENAFGHADPTGEKIEPGRFVPPSYVHGGINGKPEKTYHTLKQKPYVKSYVAISTDVPRGEKPRVLDRGSR